MKLPVKPISILAIAISSLFLTGCGGDNPATTTTPAAPEDGSVNTAVTDAVSDKYSQVWVNIEKITAKDTSGATVIISPVGTDGIAIPLGSVNLLSLKDEILNFGDNSITEGTYSDIKVTLQADSKIVVFDLLGNKKEITPATYEMELVDTFDVTRNAVSNVLIDFDVDMWEGSIDAYVEGNLMALDQLPIKKVVNDPTNILEYKPVKVKFDQVQLVLRDGKIFSKNLKTEVEREVIFSENEDTSTLVDGQLYELEGLINSNGDIIIDEIELNYESMSVADKQKHDDDEDKILMDSVSVYGTVIMVDGDLLEVEVDRSTVIFPTATILVKVDTTVDTGTRIKHGDLVDITTGTRLKIKGEVTTSDLSYVEAYKITIKDGEINPIVGSTLTKVKIKAMVQMDANGAFTILPDTSNPTIDTVLAAEGTYKTNRSTTICLSSNEFIGATLKGLLDATTNTLSLKSIKTDQRCTSDASITKGYISGFAPTSCVAATDNNLDANITGKYTIVSYTNATSGESEFWYDKEVEIKIRKDGSTKIESESATEVADVLAVSQWITSSAAADAIFPTYAYVTGDGEITFATSSDVETSLKYVLTYENQGRYVEVKNLAGDSVLLQASGKTAYYKSIACNITINDQEDGTGSNRDLVIGTGTKWYGTSYDLEEGRRVKVVADVDGNVSSIRLGGFDNEVRPIDVLRSELSVAYDVDPLVDVDRKLAERDKISKLLRGGFDEDKVSKPKFDQDKADKDHDDHKDKDDDRNKRPTSIYFDRNIYTDSAGIEHTQRYVYDSNKGKVKIKHTNTNDLKMKYKYEITETANTYEAELEGRIVTSTGLKFDDVEGEGTVVNDTPAGRTNEQSISFTAKAVYEDSNGVEHVVTIVGLKDATNNIVTFTWADTVMTTTFDYVETSLVVDMGMTEAEYEAIWDLIEADVNSQGLETVLISPIDMTSELATKALYGYASIEELVVASKPNLVKLEPIMATHLADAKDRADYAAFYKADEVGNIIVGFNESYVNWYHKMAVGVNLDQAHEEHIIALFTLFKASIGTQAELDAMKVLIDSFGGWDVYWASIPTA